MVLVVAGWRQEVMGKAEQNCVFIVCVRAALFIISYSGAVMYYFYENAKKRH